MACMHILLLALVSPLLELELTVKYGAQKLQIQWGCTKRRKNMSREMNGTLNKKKSREEHDKHDSLQHKNQKRKAEKDIKFNESSHYRWDKSDLAEELDPPSFVPNKCNSSGITQYSNKKKGFHDADPNKRRPGILFSLLALFVFEITPFNVRSKI
ncbi:hypothetical protein M5K25_016723 [Dendrobium thyrsiflorum]|uniref:Uncharacterized protein n=1 Tax=Dendrobium thyrsiflorum TaxID=117978 RepID=A0ABD0UKY6_DENTH